MEWMLLGVLLVFVLGTISITGSLRTIRDSNDRIVELLEAEAAERERR
ncbi:hypothetical protein [Agromyces intestinalis]|nr:hypothetical protein [Agromyces intestinalis]